MKYFKIQCSLRGIPKWQYWKICGSQNQKAFLKIYIEIKGARWNNLKNIECSPFPLNILYRNHGVSGHGLKVHSLKNYLYPIILKGTGWLWPEKAGQFEFHGREVEPLRCRIVDQNPKEPDPPDQTHRNLYKGPYDDIRNLFCRVQKN